MIFEVEISLLNEPAYRTQLLRLLAGVMTDEGRHRWNVSDSSSIEATSWWAEYLSPAMRGDFVKIITGGAHSPSPKDRQNYFWVGTNSDRGISVFPIAQAIELLESPIQVFVENVNQDGLFLEALVRCFGGKMIKKFLANGWLKCVHGGGKGEISNLVLAFESKVGYAVAQRLLFILIDSDKKKADDDWASEPNARKCKQLADRGYRVHALYKRMAESYLPLEAIRTFIIGDSNSEKAFQTYRMLSPEGLDFDSELKKKINKRIQENGVSKNVPLATAFRDESNVTRQSLMDRCSHHPEGLRDELKQLIDRISAML